MNFNWQEIIALLLAAIAAGYLARRAWRVFGRGCQSCSRCADQSEGGLPRTKQLVPLENKEEVKRKK